MSTQDYAWFVAGYKWHVMDTTAWVSLCGKHGVLSYAAALRHESVKDNMDLNSPDACKICAKKLSTILEKLKRVLICGDRHWKDYDTIDNFVKTLPKTTIVIQGMCRGADVMARTAAIKYGLTVKDFEAKWEKYGNAAGPIRNAQMIAETKPTIVVAFHGDLSKSRGTADMLKQATAAGIPIKHYTGKALEK